MPTPGLSWPCAQPLGALLVTRVARPVPPVLGAAQQRHGTVNADGFGVGWYAEGDPVPARYRRAGPIWADQSFADLARVTRTGALLGAVRTATLVRCRRGEAAAAPFAAADLRLFSHNGAACGLAGFAGSVAATLPPGRPAVAGGAQRPRRWCGALVLAR